MCGPGMKYPFELIVGLSSSVSLLTAVISLANDWTWGVLLGLSVWGALMPLSPISYFGRTLSDLINDFRLGPRYRDVDVPQSAKAAADKFGISPPNKAKVMPDPGLNAKVNDDYLFVTEGLWSGLWTLTAKGVMAHEMAHLARKHGRQRSIAFWVLAVAVFLFSGTVLADFSVTFVILVMLSIALTAWPLVSTRVRHHQEYDADRQAAKIVGPETMVHTLKSIADRNLWKVDSYTHPSIERRLGKLEREGNRNHQLEISDFR